MIDIIKDTLIDSIKLIPFLFIAFLIIELIEHKLSKKSTQIIYKPGKFGPIIGSILGAFPQCGFSVMATNLYITRIISLGTLVAIYLSTSDEMLPILLSEKVDLLVIAKILLLKILIGMIVGFIIDLLLRKKDESNMNLKYNLCEEEHCDCAHHLIKSVIKHTLSITMFIMIISFFLNLLFELVGIDTIKNILDSSKIVGPFLASLIGLIPNCGASVAITSLYLNGVLAFSSLIAGLLTGSGVAILVLFRYNKNLKENISILTIIYLIGVLSGIIIELLGITV